MDSFDVTKAPLAFQEWRNTFWFCTMYTNVAWTIVYVGLIQKSMQDRSYAMPFFSQCCNIAWEITFGFVCPTDHWLVTLCFRLAVIVNSLVVYTTIRYGAREWDYAPLVKRNLGMIYVLGIGVAITGQIQIAKQLGRSKACFIIAICLQVVLSVGSLCQLLVRGSTRGFSFTLWFVLPRPLHIT